MIIIPYLLLLIHETNDYASASRAMSSFRVPATDRPRASCFKAGRGAQDGLLGEATPHDLQADWQAIVREAHRNAGSRLAAEVEGVGEEGLQRTGHWLTCDFRWAKKAQGIGGRGKGWRQEQLVLLEEGHEQIMHRVAPIHGREGITGSHLLSKRQEGSHHRIELLGKACRKLLLKLDQQARNNHPQQNLLWVGDLWASLFHDAAKLLKGAHGGLTAFQHLRINTTIPRRGTPGDTHPLDLTIARLQVAAGLGG